MVHSTVQYFSSVICQRKICVRRFPSLISSRSCSCNKSFHRKCFQEFSFKLIIVNIIIYTLLIQMFSVSGVDVSNAGQFKVLQLLLIHLFVHFVYQVTMQCIFCIFYQKHISTKNRCVSVDTTFGLINLTIMQRNDGEKCNKDYTGILTTNYLVHYDSFS